MRHEKAELLLRLALDLQGSAEGLTLADIQEKYGVSRRTAERLRDAVERLVPQFEQANPHEMPKRWRITGGMSTAFVQPTAAELAALQQAIKLADQYNKKSDVTLLEGLARKIAAQLKPATKLRLAPDIETLLQSEGLALRPGPRLAFAPELHAQIQQSILACRKLRLHYRARGTGALSRQLVAPYGVLYGQRPYLVAYSFGQKAYRLWSLANIERLETSTEIFVRDPQFNLNQYAARSFGVFQEEPVEVVLRFAPQAAAEAAQFLFHPSQRFASEKSGSLLVRFNAGGMQEICWHLFTWADAVEIVSPAILKSRMRELLQKSRLALQKKHSDKKRQRNVPERSKKPVL